MATIYISSTFIDLREYRAKVIETLTQLGHKVYNMENYVAEDKIPLDKCLDDIEQCNIYLGIYGWRYGFIPNTDNPEKLSITEQEYLHAKHNNITCLLFVLDEHVGCLPSVMDAFTGDGDGGKKIKKFRNRLSDDKLISSFKSPDDLARRVSVSVSLSIAKSWQENVGKTESFADIERSPLGASLTIDIIDSVKKLIKDTKNIGVIEINSHHGDYWWSSRLFLLSALVVDYTSIKCFVFLYNTDFVGLATPQAILKSLTFEFPAVAMAYYGTLHENRGVIEEEANIINRVQGFSMNMGMLQGGEKENKVIVDKNLLEKWLGKAFKTDFIEMDTTGGKFEQAKQILNMKFPFIPLVRKKNLVSIIDKTEFAGNIATSVLNL